MIKFVARLAQGSGNLYGFGLTESNLNRLEFNHEPIFFSFDYAGHPNLFGLIVYTGEFETPLDIAGSLETTAEAVVKYCVPFFDEERGVTPETLRFFLIARSVMEQLRSTPFWGFDTEIEITNPADQQLFFAGRDSQDIESYLQKAGLISSRTKRTHKGFGKL